MAKEKLADDSSESKTQPGFFSAVEYVVPTPMELAILAASLYGKSNAESAEGAVIVAFEVWNQSFNHLNKKRELEEASLPVIAETKARDSRRELILDNFAKLGIKFPPDSEMCKFSEFAKQMLPGVVNAEATIISLLQLDGGNLPQEVISSWAARDLAVRLIETKFRLHERLKSRYYSDLRTKKAAKNPKPKNFKLTDIVGIWSQDWNVLLAFRNNI